MTDTAKTSKKTEPAEKRPVVNDDQDATVGTAPAAPSAPAKAKPSAAEPKGT